MLQKIQTIVLGEVLLKQLSQALENSVAIDRFGTQNNIRIDSNAITSVFGKKQYSCKITE